MSDTTRFPLNLHAEQRVVDPSKLSQLANDVGFITVDDVPKKLSEFENDSNYAKKSDIPAKVNIDTSLSVSGEAADAKAVGDELSNISASVEAKIDKTAVASGYATKTEIATERARIDSLATLVDGSTTGDAELADARIGADGVSYVNVGDAIRKQVSQITSDIDDIKNLTTKSLVGEFIIGTLSTAGGFGASTARVCNSEIVIYANETTISVASGFRAYVHYYNALTSKYNNGTVSGWITTQYTIPAGSLVKIVIAKSPDATVNTIEEYTRAITIENQPQLIKTIDSYNRRITGSEENINSALIDIAEIKNKISVDETPDYWKTHINAKLPSINEAIYNIGNHGDYFTFFTDYHTNDQFQPTTHLAMKYLFDNSSIKKCVFGGDILTRETKETAINRLSTFMRDFSFCDKFYPIVGNHDLNPYPLDDNSEYKLSDDEVYAIMFKGLEESNNVNLQKRMYYTRDNKTQKIRYIHLNTDYDANPFLRDTVQANWFINELNNVPNDEWTVVVFAHIMTALDGDTAIALNASGTRITKICDAYRNKTSGSHSVSTSGANNTVSFDFTKAHGNLACIISGHTHRDYTINSDAGYPMIATVCDNMYGSSQVQPTGRTRGTATEEAFDVMYIDTTAKTIKAIRIGAGSDREWSY